MKNKDIKINLFIFLPLLLVVCFCFGRNALTQDIHPIIISAIQTSGTSSDNDFIELYNTTCKNIDLSDYKIKKKTKSGSTEISIGTLKKSIPAKGYFLWENIKDATIGVPDYTTKTYYLSDDYSIAIFDKNEKQIDSITWGENLNPFENTLAYANNPKKSEALRRSPNDIFTIKENYLPKNTSLIEIEEFDLCQKEDPPTEKIYSDKIIINEFLPAPATASGDEEFIELYNPSEKNEDLSDWILRDGSKTGKYIFPSGTQLKPAAFLVVYKKDFKFALNNSGAEKVLLLDPTEKEISRVEYSSSKTDYSYAFNGSTWHWTPRITPGKENAFSEIISGKIKKDKTIYAGVYAEFEVEASENSQHFTWNFGDGHKSYLKKTRHKYADSGEYAASLKITGDGEDNLINFTVSVEDFKKAKVRIISLSPNPKGKDSENEWVEIINKTKKRINLKGWSIATGWKKLYNHPIKKDFILKAGKSKKLTREICAFSLGNKQAKVELRYPNGKIADKLKYNRKDTSISEDELFQKDKATWHWTEATPTKNTKKGIPQYNATENTENMPEELSAINLNNLPDENIEKKEVSEPATSINASNNLGKSTADPTWSAKQKVQLILLFSKSNIDPEKFLAKNQGRVLGISTTKSMIAKTTPINSFGQFWKKINAKLNQLISMF